jgi:hypothetical protein
MSPKDQAKIDALGRDVVRLSLAWRSLERSNGSPAAIDHVQLALRDAIDALQAEVDRHVPPARLQRGGEA